MKLANIDRYEIILETDPGSDDENDIVVCLEQNDDNGNSCMVDSQVINNLCDLESAISSLCKANDIERTQVAAIIDNL